MIHPIRANTMRTTAAAIPTLRVVDQGVERAHPRLRPGQVVVLIDAWVILGALWVLRIQGGTLDLACGLFGLSLFAMLLASRRSQRLSPSALDDAGHVLIRVAVAYGLASVPALTLHIGNPVTLLTTAAVLAPALVIGRAASYAAERTVRRHGEPSRTLVVGAGEIARRVTDVLSTHREYGLEVVGAVDDDPRFDSFELGTSLLGGYSDIPALVTTQGIDVVIVSFGAREESGMLDVIRSALSSGAQVWVVPRFFELGMVGGYRDHLWGLPVVRLQPPARSRPAWAVKRTLDVSVAGLGLLLAAPVMAVLAIATWVDSGRPIFYRQERIGLDGRPFGIFKFRTMRDAPPDAQSTEWTSESRITRVGRFLRDTSLDELPQLWNILRGDMSLVGPRPERPYFVDLFRELYPQYDSRHRLPSGLTGWAQVHGLRGDTSIEDRTAFDNFYIENWSPLQDLKILMRTVTSVFRR